MSNIHLGRLMKVGLKNMSKFKSAATIVTRETVSGTTLENMKVISMFTARDMALGEALTKNSHVLKGVLIGMGATFIVSTYISEKRDNEIRATIDILERGEYNTEEFDYLLGKLKKLMKK